MWSGNIKEQLVCYTENLPIFAFPKELGVQGFTIFLLVLSLILPSPWPLKQIMTTFQLMPFHLYSGVYSSPVINMLTCHHVCRKHFHTSQLSTAVPASHQHWSSFLFLALVLVPGKIQELCSKTSALFWDFVTEMRFCLFSSLKEQNRWKNRREISILHHILTLLNRYIWMYRDMHAHKNIGNLNYENNSLNLLAYSHMCMWTLTHYLTLVM